LIFRENQLEVKKRERNNVIIFDIIGDFQKSTPNIGTLHQSVKDQLKAGKRNFLLNLENVDNIDDFGLGEILASYISIRNLGGKAKHIPVKFFVEHNIKIDYRMGIFEDEEKAIMSFFE